MRIFTRYFSYTRPLSHIMKKIHFRILHIALCGFSYLLFFGCTGKKENTDKPDSQIEYEFERKAITYDLGNGLTKNVELYIDKLNDTIANQVLVYNDRVLDSSKSLFYTVSLEKIKNSNQYRGKIKYNFNPEHEGKLVGLTFVVISKTDEKTDFLTFNNSKNGKSQLEFNIKHNSDTLVGHIHAQHSKDTVVNGENKLRFRERFISVDNYLKTNNPFTKGLR